MSKKKLQVNPSKKIRGIRVVVFCNKCKRELPSSVCKKEKGDALLCPYSETHHVFKYYLHLPGTKNKRVVKLLKGIKNIDEVHRLAMNHKQELRNGRMAQQGIPTIQLSNNTKQQSESPLLKNLLAQHLDFLSNFNVPDHLKGERSKDYLDDIARGYKYLCQGLIKQGYDLDSLRISDLNDDTVGAVHNFLLKDRNFSNRSYSKYMQHYTTFLDYSIEQGYGNINYFKKVPRKTTHYTPEIISKEDFEKLLSRISPENGIQINPGQKKKRNMYFSWLAYALKISLETGRRRPEIANMRMSDIYSEGGIPIFIKVADSKVNNIKNLKNSAKKYVYVPVSKGLNELIKSGYEEYQKNKIDCYIVAPEITEKREEKICDSLSRGFAHFYTQIADNVEVKHFGCLRKTYLTGMSIHTSGRAQVVSGHSEGAILNKHYIDPKAVASVIAAQNFEVFPTEENKRNEELSQIRTKESVNKAIER